MMNVILASSGALQSTRHPDLRELADKYLTTAEEYLSIGYGTSILLIVLFFCLSRSLKISKNKSILLPPVIIVLSAITAITYFTRTQWAQDVHSMKLFAAPAYPRLPKNVSYKYYQKIYYPRAQDILFGDRMDLYFLHAKRKFLDYHSGNKIFLQKMDRARSIYLNMQHEFKSQFLTSLFMDLIESNMLFILLNDYGDWELVDAKDAIELTRRQLLTVKHSCGSAVIEKTKSIITKAKYGHNHKIGRRFTPKLMDRLQEMIYFEDAPVTPKTHAILSLPFWLAGNNEKNLIKSYTSDAMIPLQFKSFIKKSQKRDFYIISPVIP